MDEFVRIYRSYIKRRCKVPFVRLRHCKCNVQNFQYCHELEAFMRTEFLCVSVLRVVSGPRVKLASCKSALNPTVLYSTDRSKAVVPVSVLLFVALWLIYEAICCLSFHVSFCSCVF